MRLYLQETDRLLRFNLYDNPEGSLIFTYKNNDTGFEHTINIDSVDNTWVLKSNGSVNIIGDNVIIPSVILKEYTCIPINTPDNRNTIYMYSLPTDENDFKSYSVENIEQITIGKDKNSNIKYNQKLISGTNSIISKLQDKWYIEPNFNDSNLFLYVNNYIVKNKQKLNIGDVIFINGLKIIWMGKSFKVNQNLNLLEINGLQLLQEINNVNNNEYTESSEIDDSIDLYKPSEYFSHTPRIKLINEEKEIIIDSPPPSQNNDGELPLFLAIGSSFAMMGMSLIMVYTNLSGVFSGEKTFVSVIPSLLICLCMVISSLVMPLLIRNYQKKLSIKKESKRQKKYAEYLDRKVVDIERTLKKEREILNENNYDLVTCQNKLLTNNRTIWSRKIIDDDFLTVRLGIGDIQPSLHISAIEEKFSLDDDNLLQMVFSIKDKYLHLKGVPISYSFKEELVSALVLNCNFKYDYIKSLMVQMLLYYSSVDLKIIVITKEETELEWDYLKYVQHTWNEEQSMRFFATNQEEIKAVSQALEIEYNDRKEKKREIEKEAKDEGIKSETFTLYNSYYLIITDNFNSIKNCKFINDMLSSKINYGFSIIAIDNEMKNLPKECSKFICVSDSDCAIFSDKFEEDKSIKFKAEYIENADMRKLTKIINNIPIDGKNIERQLPNTLSFLEMYNVGKIEQLDIKNRWKNSDPTTSLKVPVGVHENGDLFYLDLHEKHDGPHGLIAGSTGSGKSEFIITYILSMALNYDPREVQFVLIDYKGGGLAGAFENRETNVSIPHLVGTITNLDTTEMNRTLTSIESEIKRRQKVFNTARENTGESTMDIYKYQRLYRDGVIENPVSHLFIISDEFAELKSQQPEFMNQLISISRIGRSLGVHLILATQKPSGVVNDQIWSNSRFKVCLKVQTKSDSMELLKRPEAAYIKETGRFYLQVGYDEYFEIGQSAWSGNKYVPAERIIKKVDDSVVFIDTIGNTIKRTNNSIKTVNIKNDLGDQLTNITKYLVEIAKKDNFAPSKLWLPSLPSELFMSNLISKYNYKNEENSITTILGEYDSPELQVQGVATFDFIKNGNLLIYGATGSGKENLISTIIYNICSSYSPEKVNFYIGDFGAETLKLFKKYPHVGDTFFIDDQQKILNLIKLIDKEFERRKNEYSDFGGNYTEYNKTHNDPLIFIVLNNYEVFLETYTRNQDIFIQYIRDGAKYGIQFIVSTSQPNAVRIRVAEYFINKVGFKFSNDYDYRDLIGAPRGLIPKDLYGRGLYSVDKKNVLEFQTASINTKEDINQTILNKGIELKERYNNIKVKKIPIIPEIVYVDDIMYELKDLKTVPIGIERNSIEVYVYDFLTRKTNIITAQNFSSHIYFVYALVKEFKELKNYNITLVDTIGDYKYNTEGINLIKSDFRSKLFEIIEGFKTNKSNIYMFTGIKQFIEKLDEQARKAFIEFINIVKSSDDSTIIFMDNYDGIKDIQTNEWFRENVNNTYGIWLGDNVDSQIALSVMSMSFEEKQVKFSCIGYPVYQGNHMIIKYMVDGVDRKDEE